MPSVTRLVLERLLPHAEALLDDAEQRLAGQRIRVAALDNAGPPAEQSRRLLKHMEQAYLLQAGYVAMLKRDMTRPDYAVPLPYLPPQPPPEEWRPAPPGIPGDELAV